MHSTNDTINVINRRYLFGVYSNSTQEVIVEGLGGEMRGSVESYGIYIESGEANVGCNNFNVTSGGTSIGLYGPSATLYYTSGKINTNAPTSYGVYVTGGYANIQGGTIKATGTNAYGGYMTSGTLILGIEDGSGTQQADVSTTEPHLEGVGTTTGIGVSMGNGTLNYYDGKLVGSTSARGTNDITSNIEKNYQVVTYTDEVTGYQYCILEYIM